MKTLAFVIGLLIGVVGAVGIIAPSCLVWIAEHSVTSGWDSLESNSKKNATQGMRA